MSLSDCGWGSVIVDMLANPGWSVNAPLCNCLEGKSKVCRTKLCFYCKLFFCVKFQAQRRSEFESEAKRKVSFSVSGQQSSCGWDVSEKVTVVVLNLPQAAYG